MKIVINEKIKHRLVGLLVIASLGVMFAPAIIKKSQMHQQILHVQMSIPQKPEQPQLAIPEKAEVFAQVKMVPTAVVLQKSDLLDKKTSSHVLPIPKATTIASVTHLSKKSSIASAPARVDSHSAPLSPSTLTPKQKSKIPTIVLQKLPAKKVLIPKPVAKALNQIKKKGYSIQLAYFTSESNAKGLVGQLKKKGYPARIDRVKNRRGVFYKVIVGSASDKRQIEIMQKKLADAVNLKGFIIKGSA